MDSQLRKISTLVQSSIPKHVTIRLDLDEAIPFVEADASQLQQLVMNLIINGAEAIPEDRVGRLLVTAVSGRDFPVVQGVTMMVAVVTLLINLLVDITYAYVDPRIRT